MMSDRIFVLASVQVNTVKGFRYLDDAGKILNEFDDEFPEKHWALEGLQLTNSANVLRQLRVNTTNIWLQFEEPPSMHLVIAESRRVIPKICQLLAVHNFSRQGLRLQYIYPVTDWEASIARIRRSAVNPNLLGAIQAQGLTHHQAFEITLPLQSERLGIILRIFPVERQQEKDKPLDRAIEGDQLPARGIMVDVDIYVAGATEVKGLTQFFRDAEVWANGPLEEIVGSFMTESNDG